MDERWDERGEVKRSLQVRRRRGGSRGKSKANPLDIIAFLLAAFCFSIHAKDNDHKLHQAAMQQPH